MEYSFDKNFKIPSWALYLNKTHPTIKRNWKWLLNFTILHSIFTTLFIVVMYNIIFINIKGNNFDDACRNGVYAIVYLVISFENFLMSWKQSVLANIMDFMAKDYNTAKNLCEEEQNIVEKYIKAGDYVTKQWLAISVGGCAMFPLKNIVILSYLWSIGEPRFVSMIELVYPDIIEENKDNIYMFSLTYAWILYFGLYATITYIGFVPLGPVFIIHACGQLELVENKIKSLFQGSLTDTEVKLKEIVKQLQCIYGFVAQILSAFQIIYEFTLRFTTLLLPITLYEIIEALHNGDLPLEFISFIVGGFIISSSPCYYGDLLMEKAEKVRIAMYSCGWESVPDRRTRSTILIIMTRTLKPVAIQTLFRTVSLETLADLLQQSYALFNLMNSMWK